MRGALDGARRERPRRDRRAHRGGQRVRGALVGREAAGARASGVEAAGGWATGSGDREDVREVIERSYRIVYRVVSDGIVVLTVFEGHRLLGSIDPDAR